MPEDPAANLLLANAYIWTGNNTKAVELANKAIEETKNTPSYYKWLCAAAGIYEQTGDFATAEAKYKESSQIQPNQMEAIEKLGYSEEDEVVAKKLSEERNAFLNQAIPYFKAAISYIDSLSEAEQAQNRPQLYSCLRTLNTCYITLEKYDESKTVKARLDKIEAGANN